MKLRADTIFYHIGRWIWIPFIIAGFWFAKYGYGEYHQLFDCTFYRVSGLPCPGCGGTRAFYYLFSGDIRGSFLHNPVVLYGILAYLHFMGLYFFRHHLNREKNVPVKEIQIPVYIYVAIVVILVQWLVKILGILL